MFLVKDSSLSREKRIKQLLDEDPALAVLLSVIHFEWTIRRTIIALSTAPNVSVREKLKKSYGLKKYKEVWKEEVSSNVPPLSEVVENWDGLERAFKLRNRLVHGVASCGAEYATKRVDWAIDAAINVRAVCEDKGIDLDSRLAVRRSVKSGNV